MKNKFFGKSDLMLLLLIVSIQLIVFLPSFKLALFGDDWMVFWRYKRLLVENAYHQNFTHLTYFLTPYGPMDINFGLLQKIFSYNSVYYQIVAFIYRFILTATIYLSMKTLLKSKLAGFTASLFFSIATAGLDTTNWVFNMTSYLGMAAGVVFLYFYFTSSVEKSLKRLIFSYVFLFLAFIIVPVRAHGFIPLILLMEGVRLFFGNFRLNVREIPVRIILLVITVFLVRTIGTSFANPDESIFRMKTGLSLIKENVKTGQNYGILLYLPATVSNLLIPDRYLPFIEKQIDLRVLGRARPFPLFSFFVFSFYSYFLSLIAKDKAGSKIMFFKRMAVFISLAFAYNAINWVFYKLNPVTFSSFPIYGRTLIGGYFILLLIAFSLYAFDEIKFKLLALTGVFWMVSFLLLPWVSNPYSIFETTHRYMIGSAIGISIFIAGVIKSNLFKAHKYPILLIILIFTLIHAKATNYYLKSLVGLHGIKIADKIWTFVDRNLPLKTDKFYAVAFIPDSQNGTIVHNNAFFGFPPRMSLRGNYLSDLEMPIATMGTEELTNFVMTGERLSAHGKEPVPLPLDRFYAFEIKGTRLEDIVITDKTRELRTYFEESLHKDQ